MIIVNNTNTDIQLFNPMIVDFYETGVLHEDIADIFEVTKVTINGEDRVIVDFLD